jgi:hypothetical protein
VPGLRLRQLQQLLLKRTQLRQPLLLPRLPLALPRWPSQSSFSISKLTMTAACKALYSLWLRPLFCRDQPITAMWGLVLRDRIL